MTPTTPSRLASPEPLAPIARALAAGTLPPLAYLARLERRFADREPFVEAFLPEPERFARLAREAEALERRHPAPAAPPRRPPLFALPVAVKDVFHAAGLPTRAGSRLPEELVARLCGASPSGTDPEAGTSGEAEAVARLRRAGACLLGKTVTTELAYFAPGRTRNPHDLEHTPGGSSSGSAAAVAAGLAPLALGTQTIGSVCRPAAFCGVVGLKPTAGRVPCGGLVPLAPSLDQVGLFAADVAGAALGAAALADRWRGLPALRGAPVLGVVGGEYLERAGEAALEVFREAVGRLREAGARLVEADPFPDLAAIESRHRTILAAEAARVHAGWFPRREHLCDARTAELLREGADVADAALAAALSERDALRRRLGERTTELGVDLWLSPAAPGTAPRGLGSTGDPVMNLPWTQAGVPALSLPCGTSPEELPYGLQLAGRFGEDEALLARALWVEEALAAGGPGR